MSNNKEFEKKNGYNVIIEDPELQDLRDQYKIPIDCHICSKLMENWDNQFFFRYGTCSNCYIDYIEDRNIDETILKNRLLLKEYIIQKRNQK